MTFKTHTMWVGKWYYAVAAMPAGHLSVSLCVFNFVQLQRDKNQCCDLCDTSACKCKLAYKNGCDSINSRLFSDTFCILLFTVHGHWKWLWKEWDMFLLGCWKMPQPQQNVQLSLSHSFFLFYNFLLHVGRITCFYMAWLDQFELNFGSFS